MKILITGASGQLGTEIQRQLKNGGSALGPVPERLKNATVIATDVAELDITDRDATIAFVRRHSPIPSSAAPPSPTWTAARQTPKPPSR